MKYIRFFALLGTAAFCFSSFAAEKTITQEDFKKILLQFEKEYNSSKTLYEYLRKVPTFSSFDYALIAQKVNLEAPPTKIKVDPVAMTVTFANGVVFKWTSPLTGDAEIDGQRYTYDPSQPLGGYLKARKFAFFDFQILPNAEAQFRKEYKVEEHSQFPVQLFWQAASDNFKDASLKLADKSSIEAAAILPLLQETVKDLKTSMRGEKEITCTEKGQGLAAALGGDKVVLKNGACESKDSFDWATKRLAAFRDSSIKDVPDKTFEFDVQMSGEANKIVSVDWDKGHFWYQDSTGYYNVRFEGGKAKAIAEMTVFRTQEVTEKEMQPGKGKVTTADPRAVWETKKALVCKETEEKLIKDNSRRNRHIVDLCKKKGTTFEELDTLANKKQLATGCAPEIKATPRFTEEQLKSSTGSLVRPNIDPVVVSTTNDIPAPVYDPKKNKVCKYEGSLIVEGDKRHNRIKGIADRIASALTKMRDSRFCSDSCRQQMMPILASHKFAPDGKPKTVEYIKLQK